jgi:hypothetical protein
MLTILYTFDAEEENLFPLLLLEASIISALEELGEQAEIFLFTTKTLSMKVLAEKLNVEVIEYKPEDFHHPYRPGAVKSRFDIIGHARVFLIPHLLEKFKRPLVYVDNDTLFRDGKSLKNIISLATAPLGYVEEKWLMKNGKPNSLLEVKRFHSKDADMESFPGNAQYGSMICVNNGVQVYPFNSISLEFCALVIRLFLDLREDKNFCSGDDQFAFTIAHRQTMGCSVLVKDLLTRDDLVDEKKHEKSCIVHYYFGKGFMKEKAEEKIRNFYL